MQCPKCGAQNRDESNFCRYCATPLAASERRDSSGYIPSVPPPDQSAPNPAYTPPSYQVPPAPPAPFVRGQTVCPRCGSPSVIKGSTPVWAIVLTVIGFFFVCFFSLFLLLIKDKNKCLHCGLEF